MQPPEIFVGDLVELQRACVREVEDAVRTAIATRGRALAALPGGSVAQAFFPVLAESAADWTRTEVFWIDERAVPPRHPDSNYGLAASLLLIPAGVPEPRIHRLPGELPDLDQAARRASDELKSIAGDPPMLDLVLAGVGEDGHIASIFGTDVGTRLAAPPGPVVPVYDAPKRPARRLTMTLPVLISARRVIVAAFGRSKAGVVRDAIRQSGAATPVAELLRRTARPQMLLDRDAAELLS